MKLILNHKNAKDGVTLRPSDGTLNGVPCQGSQPPWHTKDCLPDVRKRVGLLRDVSEILTHNTKCCSLINQSINSKTKTNHIQEKTLAYLIPYLDEYLNIPEYCYTDKGS
jgi:hypothetical protein